MVRKLLLGWVPVMMSIFCAAGAGAALSSIPVSQIKPGMAGYGLTVFSGNTVERFDYEVVGVLDADHPESTQIIIRCLSENI
ncbi:hypothetical protein JW905_00380, partial [bacterium]|nr:hypothetical protein [candidate division CSSED10-310 bacterium]